MESCVDIEKNIIATIVYFDIFDYPLTATEIHQYLLATEPVSYTTILTTLNNSEKIKNLCDCREGFYFLKNNSATIDNRRERYLLAEKKFRVVKKNVRLLKRLPFIRAVFICNKLAYSNSRETGDLDLAIITAPGRIWTARFMATAIMKLLNRRPNKNTQKNKICLSFFLSSDHLDLQSYAIKNQDWHFAFWIRQFLPIYDPENLQLKLQTSNNWIKKMLPNAEAAQTNARRRDDTQSRIQKIFERLCPRSLENHLKSLQKKLLNPALATATKADNSGVVITDQILKLHLTDRREQYNNEFTKRLQELQI